jgi:hypothetical protein
MKFFDDYMHYAGSTESPKIFHMWSALSALSSAVAGKTYLDLGIFHISPNLYAVLVGSPGSKKTTSLNIAKGMVRQLKTVPICAASITREALLREMSKDGSPCKKNFKANDGKIVEFNQLSIFASELVTFLGANGTIMIEFMTDIYDSKHYEVKTKNKGDDDIVNPYITLLGCMTPEMATGYLKQSIITGGFTRRAIFVLSHDQGEPIPIPSISETQAMAYARCVEWLRTLNSGNVNGVFEWAPDALKEYEKWYVAYRKNPNKANDPSTMGYFETKPIQALKVAMLVSLADSAQLRLDKSHFEFALALLADAEKNLEQVFLGVGKNDTAQLASKIVSYLDMVNQPLTLKRIYAVMYNDAPRGREDIDRVLHHLCDTNRIEKLGVQAEGNQPVVVYCSHSVAERMRKKLG